MDGGGRLAGFTPYLEGMTQFGYGVWRAPWIGLTLLVSTVLMLVPRTAVLGCVLVTGYLGGAVASQVRVQHDPWLLFPVMLGALAWLALSCGSRGSARCCPCADSLPRPFDLPGSLFSACPPERRGCDEGSCSGFASPCLVRRSLFGVLQSAS